MVYKETNINGALKGYDSLVSIQDDNRLLFLSKEDFSILKKYDLPDFMFATHFYYDKVVLTNLQDKHIEILPKELQLLEHNGPCYPINQSVLYCPREKKYLVGNTSKGQNDFERNFDFEIKVFDQMIIECSLHQSKGGFVRANNLMTGSEEWRIDLKGKIVRMDNFEDYLILDYHDQSGKTIVIRINNGEECWQKEESYSKVDKNAGLVLFGSNEVTVVDIGNGEIINRVTILPEYHLGYYPHFIDNTGIYYTTHEGSFGKISKVNGIILWEYDLIDRDGSKRKLLDWILLENGNLVLQMVSNNPNDKLTCIFNPEENIEYSKIKNGKRISTN